MPVPGAVEDPSRLDTADVVVQSGDVAVGAYRARPRGAGLRPGVVVIHDAFGLTEHTRDVVRRFANVGFDAIAPDLFVRTGMPRPDDMADVMRAMSTLDDAEVVADVTAAAAHLRGLDGSSGRVGVVGFCMGGRYTLLATSTSDAFAAAVDCWGGNIDRASPDAEVTPKRPVKVTDLAPGLHCPLLLIGGAEDQNPSPELLRRLHDDLRAAGKDVTLEIFDNAGHAFFADFRPSYREEAAQRLWPMMVDFLRTQLS
ncbi:MAG TPA: dienelactone hydrolase family protein [Candidatus Dormibacteraeota bacterium]|jgi:carboxymethylenebutenolidase|nr:dienelactone hydrolase family protein [Candidatus Dormibacteraeota bacterium]